jgi:uridine kinase
VTAPGGGRAALVRSLAEELVGRRAAGPLRVGVDGRSAAGKTTLADELDMVVRALGRPCVRASVDDFHPPGHAGRSGAGAWTPERYYAEGFDYRAFRELLLAPLGPGGDRRCQLALWDAFHDVAAAGEVVQVPEDAVVVVDGAFLLRPELRDCWDYVIWVQVDWDTMVERGVARDVAWVGPEQAVRERYRRLWIPLHELYERHTGAPGLADVVVDNTDPAHPRLERAGA